MFKMPTHPNLLWSRKRNYAKMMLHGARGQIIKLLQEGAVLDKEAELLEQCKDGLTDVIDNWKSNNEESKRVFTKGDQND